MSQCRIASVLAACIALGVAGSAGGEVRVWAVDDMVRIDPQTGRVFEGNPTVLRDGVQGDYRKGNAVFSADDRTVRLSAGRNEVVAFQVIVEGRADAVDVVAGPLAGPGGARIAAGQFGLYRQWYIWVDAALGNQQAKGCMLPLGPGWYPEIAIPMDTPKVGRGFSIPSADFHDPSGAKRPKQTNQAVWVDLHVPADATAGEYDGRITVRADGATHALAIKLTVWDFVIPSTMQMHAELMTYGTMVRQPDAAVMLAYFRLAHEHRTVISDSKARPPYDGQRFDWKAFDARLGPLFDGSGLTDGPCAGGAIGYWTLPIEFSVDRTVDKSVSWVFRDWPVVATKTASGFGVVFGEVFAKQVGAAIRRYHRHFVENRWTDTHLYVWQNCLDEPALHKTGRALAAGREQVKAIYDTARLVGALGIGQVSYKLDIGSGFVNNKLDLDGDGKRRGAYDVASYLGPVVDLWSISGLRIVMDALKPALAAHGSRAVFYNGYHPRVAGNTIHSELLGFRQWAVAAWRSGLRGWADWEFTKTDGKQVFYEPNADGRNLYLYHGGPIGLGDRVFASLRLKSMRRGAQDFEMLRLLTGKDGHPRRAQALAATVTGAGFTDVTVDIKEIADVLPNASQPYTGVGKKTHWSHDPADWAAFHRALGAALAEP